MVVNVAALLELPDHQAAAVATVDQAGQGELTFRFPRLVPGPPVKDRLNTIPGRAAHEGHVGAFVHAAIEVEVAV